MTAPGPTSRSPQSPVDDAPPPAPSRSEQRARSMNMANMARSLLPLVVLCLAVTAWVSLGRDTDDPVTEVDPSTTVELAASRADYPVLVPTGLAAEFRPTSARTDAGNAEDGEPVTLEIGYYTPAGEFAGFVVSDDADAEPLDAVLEDATEQDTVEIAGQTWRRSTTASGETALTREDAGVTVLVTGSAPDEELVTVAAAVRPYSD